MDDLNPISLDTLCAGLAYAAGVEAPAQSAPANPALTAFADQAFGGEKADRLFMYNPDAVAQWIVDKYPEYLSELLSVQQLALPMQTVMPSVTPVCFGTMYTGAQPAVHGIRKYEKPVIKIDSLFDAFIRAGKKCAIVSQVDCSMSKIYQEREMDYFIYGTIAESNAKAAELILADRYDLLVVYNTNYDHVMHKNGPEAARTLAELRCNDEAFGMFYRMIQAHWTGHNTLMGFAMDHGCHAIDGGCGSHGLDMPEDLNIRHYYTALPRK